MECYVFIYLSNEEEQANIAYFDDVSIEHKHFAVIQEESYYPFSMSQHYSYQRELTKEQKNGYNGVEFNDVFQLYETLFRGYDPALGRFHQVDPMTDFIPGITPYNFAYNNPISFNDPTGLLPGWMAKIVAPIKQFIYNITGRGNQHAKVNITKNGEWQGSAGGKTKGRAKKSNKSSESSSNSNPLPKPSFPTSDFAEFNAPMAIPDELISKEQSRVFSIGDIEIDANKPGIITQPIPFHRSSPQIYWTVASDKFLSDLIKYLKEYPDFKVDIEGHAGTDFDGQVTHYGRGEKVYKQSGFNFGALMNDRAKAIYDLLIKNGIDAKRLRYGPGELHRTPKGRVVSFDIYENP